MQDMGLKYLHLSIDYETNIESLIEAWERQMAKETSAKWTVKTSFDNELVNQNQILSKEGNNNSKSDFILFQNLLQYSTQWLH